MIHMRLSYWFPFKAVFQTNFVLKKGIPYGFPKECLFEYKEKLTREPMRSCCMIGSFSFV